MSETERMTGKTLEPARRLAIGGSPTACMAGAMRCQHSAVCHAFDESWSAATQCAHDLTRRGYTQYAPGELERCMDTRADGPASRTVDEGVPVDRRAALLNVQGDIVEPQ
jgi:hypothetical protein